MPWHQGSYGSAQYYGPGVYYGPGGNYGGYNSGSDNSINGFGPLAYFGGFDLQKAKRIRFAHGVFASLAMVVFFPVGAISIRIIPGRLAVVVHAAFQLLAYTIYTIAVGLGIWMVIAIRFGRFDLVSQSVASSIALPHSLLVGEPPSHHWDSRLRFSLLPANPRHLPSHTLQEARQTVSSVVCSHLDWPYFHHHWHHQWRPRSTTRQQYSVWRGYLCRCCRDILADLDACGLFWRDQETTE